MLIAVPYDLGRRGAVMGAGPGRLLEAGAAEALGRDGHDVEVAELQVATEGRSQTEATFATAEAVREAVARALRAGRLPLVLSGNCHTCLGTVTALGADTAVVYFDAHGDLNTPETSPSGYLDGMALATLCGRCLQAEARTVEGFAPVEERSVVLVGGRDLDPGESALLQGSAVSRTTGRGPGINGALAGALAGARATYVHVDLDVLDPAEGIANRYAVEGGLTGDEVIAVIEAAARTAPIGAAALTAYDPSADPSGTIIAPALDIMRAVAVSAAR